MAAHETRYTSPGGSQFGPSREYQSQHESGRFGEHRTTWREKVKSVFQPSNREGCCPSRETCSRTVKQVFVGLGKFLAGIVTVPVIALFEAVSGLVTGFIEGEGRVFNKIYGTHGEERLAAALIGAVTVGLVAGVIFAAGRAVGGLGQGIADGARLIHYLGRSDAPSTPHLKQTVDSALKRTKEYLHLDNHRASVEEPEFQEEA